MKIAIISDIHNNTVNLKKVLDYCAREKIEIIICCGDLASKETLDFLNDSFVGTIHYTFGNMDNGQLRDFEFTEKYKNTFIYKKFGETEIDNNPEKPDGHGARKIAFVHFPDRARALCESGKYDFVFYGHTHKPWVASAKATADRGKKNCIMLNPGNVAGEIYPPTFAIWDIDTNKFSLTRIHNLK